MALVVLSGGLERSFPRDMDAWQMRSIGCELIELPFLQASKAFTSDSKLKSSSRVALMLLTLALGVVVL